MNIQLAVEHRMRAAPDAVFALTLDAERFPPLFAGFGPIPAIRRIEPHSPPAPGSLRTLENSDGSQLTECITALEPARRHAYTLTGLQPPLAWLVREGAADWRFEPDADGTRTTWHYRFELAHLWTWPLAWLLMRGCMREAMRRCLIAMDRTLRADSAN